MKDIEIIAARRLAFIQDLQSDLNVLVGTLKPQSPERDFLNEVRTDIDIFLGNERIQGAPQG